MPYVLNQCTLLSVTFSLSSTETDTRFWLILLSLPADMVTVLVSLHLRRLTFTGAVWIRSDSSITSFIYHLGLTQLCGVRGEACWIVHNGETCPLLTKCS